MKKNVLFILLLSSSNLPLQMTSLLVSETTAPSGNVILDHSPLQDMKNAKPWMRRLNQVLHSYVQLFTISKKGGQHADIASITRNT